MEELKNKNFIIGVIAIIAIAVMVGILVNTKAQDDIVVSPVADIAVETLEGEYVAEEIVVEESQVVETIIETPEAEAPVVVETILE